MFVDKNKETLKSLLKTSSSTNLSKLNYYNNILNY